MRFEVKMPKVRKKKPTEKEIEELREVFIRIQNDPEAMRQVRKLIQTC